MQILRPINLELDLFRILRFSEKELQSIAALQARMDKTLAKGTGNQEVGHVIIQDGKRWRNRGADIVTWRFAYG